METIKKLVKNPKSDTFSGYLGLEQKRAWEIMQGVSALFIDASDNQKDTTFVINSSIERELVKDHAEFAFLMVLVGSFVGMRRSGRMGEIMKFQRQQMTGGGHAIN